MTTALAVQADVEHALGRSLTDANEIARCTSLLLATTAQVNKYTGWRFVAGTYTIGRSTDGDLQITLPGAVSAVGAVRDIDQYDGTATTLTLGTDYTTRGRIVYLMRCRNFVEIDFTTTGTIPDEVVGMVANCVARSLAGPPVGAASETVGPFSVSYVNTSGDVYLSKTDKLILGDYKQARPAIAIIR